MDCKTKDGLLIFLLVFSGVLLAALLVIIALFCRKKVNTDVKQWDSPFHIFCWPPLYVLSLVILLAKTTKRNMEAGRRKVQYIPTRLMMSPDFYLHLKDL